MFIFIIVQNSTTKSQNLLPCGIKNRHHEATSKSIDEFRVVQILFVICSCRIAGCAVGLILRLLFQGRRKHAIPRSARILELYLWLLLLYASS